MIVIALLIVVSSLLWAALGFTGLGARSASIARAAFAALLLLTVSVFVLAHAAGA